MSVHTLLGTLRTFAGLSFKRSGHLEKWISGAGGLAGILGVMLVSQQNLGLSGSASLVASMGASAVLLFAVPHGPLSQPWPVFGGHLVSAIIGVACANLIKQPYLTEAAAVALAIGAMYYLRCIHPPGGATALTAVAGGDAVHSLGFAYVVTPVLLNVLIILVVAVVFNFPFAWRRYPAVWARSHNPPPAPETKEQAAAVFTRQDLAAAAGVIDRTLHTGGHDLDTICSLAQCNTDTTAAISPADICVGRYYCNGEFSPLWQVRLVIDAAGIETAEFAADDELAYRVVAGVERRRTGSVTRAAFARWARYEVILNETSWQRVETSSSSAAVTDNAA